MIEDHTDTTDSVPSSITLTEQDIIRFWSKTEKVPSGCVEWKAAIWKTKNNGYGNFTIRSKSFRAHRIAWMIANGSDPKDRMILHSCDNRKCVNPEHLKLGTHLENMSEMAERKRAASGDRHGSKTHPETIRKGADNNKAKLTESDVLSIRASFPATPAKLLAKQFNVHKDQIYNIVRRRHWAHI